jgi:HD-GYP domain-containing protein (c-di-GMP phosphodiesterase class II)
LMLAGSYNAPAGIKERLHNLPRASMSKRFWGSEDVFVVSNVEEFKNTINYEVYLEYGLNTVAIARMIRNQQLIGIISVSSFNEPRVFTHEELDLLKALADLSAQAISNARLFADTQRRVERLKALRDIDVAITSSFDLRVTFNILLEEVASQLRVDAVDILVLNEHTHELDFLVGRGFRTNALHHTHLRLGKGYAGTAALERRIVHVADLQTDGNLLQQSRLLLDEGFVTYYGVPLIAKGQVQGVLEVFHRQMLRPDQEWMEFFETLGGQAAIAIDNAALFNSLQRTNIDLTLAYDATIEGWSHALDLRDKETEGHTQRVTEMTVRLAQTMNIPDGEIVHIRRGALLHDIGKMGIPDGILLKPGPLTDDEWVVMRKHPVYAYEMLSPIQYLGPALEIPYCHHEKWDGSGYPRGLLGGQIPLSSRIFAIVDVWDALRSDRPYRTAWPEEKVREYVRSLSGTHFDPKVVAAFLQIF